MILLLAVLLQDDPALPRVPADWKVEVVARTPVVRHPTVVCASPDGRVFVAEDPQDMAGPVDQPLGRVVCVHPDGKSTLFADKLGVTFGIHYLEGFVYVLQLPRLTRYRDADGVGKDPVDLIPCVHPEPWRNNRYNTHIPANFRLAMDGFFYLSVGDKGIYGAVGPDGKPFAFQGGGVVRLRPDGTGLEAVSRGTRNHLDVALNAEDDLFTFDNDDNVRWGARIYHMIEGGYYGYPWDHGKPHALGAMFDGRGIPAGAAGYDEDGLPQEYRGDLFFCEWGRSQLLRVRVAREGASYRMLSREPLATRGTQEFRPVGIAVVPDGFYVTDWNTSARLVNEDAGRLLKFTGPSRPPARPSWYAAAATGRGFEASTEDLVRALRHPARAVRLVAQRRLAGLEKGPVKDLLGDAAAPASARWHAIWALDDPAASAEAARDADPSVRRQAARHLGMRRAGEVTLIGLLEDPDPGVRLAAAIGLGRLGAPRAIGGLRKLLDGEDSFLRHAASTALRRIGAADPRRWREIAAGLKGNARVREGTLFALREAYHEEVVDLLAEAGEVEVLAGLYKKPAPWNGSWWGGRPVLLPPPPKTEEYAGTPRVRQALAAAIEKGLTLETAGDPALIPALRRRFERAPEPGILRALAALKDPGLEELAARALKATAPEVRAQAARLTKAREPLVEILRREERPEVLVAVLETITSGVDAVAVRLGHADEGVAKAAAGALGRLGGERAVEALLGDPPRPEVRRAVVAALGRLHVARAVPRLLELYGDPAFRFEALSALAEIPDLRALDAYLAGLAERNPEVRGACRRAISEISGEALPHLESRVDGLPLPVLAELQRIYGAPRPLRLWRRGAEATFARASEDGFVGPIADVALNSFNHKAGRGELLVGAGTPLTVWLNGGQVYEGSGTAAEVEVRFEEGRNTIRVRAPRGFRVALPAETGGPLFARKASGLEPAAYLQYALDNAGDAGRGRRLFEDTKSVACVRCHAVGGKGGDVGPELSMVGALYSRKDLAEGVLYPSKVIVGGFRQVTVQTEEGEVFVGAAKGETAEVLVLQDAEGTRHRIPKARIARRKVSDLSLMPEGLVSALSPEEFADLISYLQTLKAEE